MLEEDPKIRIDFKQLFAILKNYKQQLKSEALQKQQLQFTSRQPSYSQLNSSELNAILLPSPTEIKSNS